MPGDPYSPLVRKLFTAPGHVAKAAGKPPEGASVYVEGQGVAVRLNAVPGAGQVLALTFRARGCPHFLAACEWLCRRYSGKGIAELDVFKPAEIMQTLGIPAAKSARILTLEDAVTGLKACFGQDLAP
jgi:NifU-like protein involved in Fe-S cluster formation